MLSIRFATMILFKTILIKLDDNLTAILNSPVRTISIHIITFALFMYSRIPARKKKKRHDKSNVTYRS